MSITAKAGVFGKIILASIMALMTSIGGLFGMGSNTSDVCMIGHRGYSGKFPENTELAFVEAAKNGSGGAETDVRVTKDGVYVLSHNSDIVLEDGTELKIVDNTYDELTAKPLKNKKTKDKVYLCTFKRYLEIMKQYNMVCFVELKGDFSKDQVKEIFSIAEETYELQKCILQSFHIENLISARELFPDLPLMLTYGQDDEGYEKCFEYGISIDADYYAMTEEMVEEFHSKGLEVGVWTVNNPFALAYAKSLGVDYIESDVYGGQK